jgi:hypothetical protein
MSDEKNVFNFQSSVKNSIVGLNVTSSNIYSGVESSMTDKTKEEWIQEIISDQFNYIGQIGQLTGVTQLEKEQAAEAVVEVCKELKKEEPSVEKLEGFWAVIKKSSEISSICGAIFSLLQLMQ